MPKYGFNENEVVSTRTILIDKDGFHKVADGESSGGASGSSLPILYINEDGNEYNRMCHLIAHSDSIETVYGELTFDNPTISDMYDENAPVVEEMYVVFSDSDIDFTEFGNYNTSQDFLDTQNLSYIVFNTLPEDIFECWPMRYHSVSLQNAVACMYWAHYNRDDADIIPEYSRLMGAEYNTPVQLFVKYRNTANSNDCTIISIGKFYWPLNKSIQYNPDGPLSATPKQVNEFNVETGVIINIEGFAKYASPKMLFVSQTDYREAGAITLNGCASVFNPNMQGTSQTVSIRSFNMLEGSVIVDGAFNGGEDNPIYLYGCHQDGNAWTIDESVELIINNYTNDMT